MTSHVLHYSRLVRGWDINASVQYMNRFKMADGIASQ